MSLHRTLILVFAALLTVLGALSAAIAYVSARHEAWEMLDLQQRQIARFVGDGSDVTSIEGSVPAYDADEDVAVEVTSPNGAPPRRSRPDVAFPRMSPPGFSEFMDGADRWRLFTLTTERRTVKVAQQIVVRDELATASALSAAIPFLFAVPLSWFVVTWLVGAIIRRLTSVARAVETRAAADTDPIALDDVPTEVRPLVTAMNGALARLQAALEQQSAFLANAAHELRSPLAAVTLQIGNLRRVVRDPAVADRFLDLEAGARRASAVTDQLLRLARQEAGEAVRRSDEIPLDAVTLDVVAGLVPLAENRGVDLGLVRSEAVDVVGDGQDLRVLIEVLIDNAVRYTPAGGGVDVALSVEGGAAVLAIADTGPGIPEHLLPRVFERFFRASDQGQEGTGLGLSIARVIADRHGIALDLDNRADRSGLVARLALPARRRRDAGAARPP